MTQPASAFTQVPNWLIEAMPKMTGAQVMVCLAVARRTLGWQKDADTISLSQLHDDTGLDRETLIEATRWLSDEAKILTRTPAPRNGFTYQLTYQSEIPTSRKIRLVKAITSRKIRPDLVGFSDPQYKDKEKTLPTGEAPSATAPRPERPPRSDRPARNPNPPVALAPPSPAAEVEQPRLVEAEIPDPITTYREVAGVKRPNQEQRAKIREVVIGYPDEWREACSFFARNGFNVRAIDNLLDRYRKLVVERRKVEARERETERQRRVAEAATRQRPATDEEVQAWIANLRAWRTPAAATA
jgi:phage replication O-like protein O